MPKQPDAYTLAAMAAADRARAAATRPTGPATRPGNPIKRIMRVPGVRWAVSGVLLAAAVGLAVDYINTPLKPWFQYSAKLPFINNGKSVAQVAAEESAAPQAKINQEIVAPAEATARANAMAEETAREENTRAHLDYTHSVVVERPTSVRVFGPASSVVDWLGKTTDAMHGLDNLAFAENSGTTTTPIDAHRLSTTVLPVGQRLGRLLYQDNRTAADTDGGAVILLLKDTVVLMARADYDVAKIVAAPPPLTVADTPPARMAPRDRTPASGATAQAAGGDGNHDAPLTRPPQSSPLDAMPATRTPVPIAASENVVAVERGTKYAMFLGSETPQQLGVKLAQFEGNTYTLLSPTRVVPIPASDGTIDKFTTTADGKTFSGFVATVQDGFLKGKKLILPWSVIRGS